MQASSAYGWGTQAASAPSVTKNSMPDQAAAPGGRPYQAAPLAALGSSTTGGAGAAGHAGETHRPSAPTTTDASISTGLAVLARARTVR
jgi:hypothetical protein